MATDERLKNLILFVCSRCDDSIKIGATKLNKILWFADSASYQHSGKSISGVRYKKLQHGPAPIGLQSAIRDLEREGRMAVKEQKFFGYTQKQFIALEYPQPNLFSDEELQFVEFITNIICEKHTANSISRLSHDSVWEAASMGEEIPLSANLAANEGVITTEDLEWADSVIEARM